jgi:type II secretory ATPase GspE/PulE/Tfp pilus assembly ATPase PilB-like protein
VVAIIKNHCNMTLNNNDAQDGRFSVKFAGRIIDARVSAIPWRRKFQKITIRISTRAPTSLARDMACPRGSSSHADGDQRPQGMIVVTGHGLRQVDHAIRRTPGPNKGFDQRADH